MMGEKHEADSRGCAVPCTHIDFGKNTMLYEVRHGKHSMLQQVSALAQDKIVLFLEWWTFTVSEFV